MAEPVRARRLTDQEGRRLLQIVRRGKRGSVRVRRAMIIMASASGQDPAGEAGPAVHPLELAQAGRVFSGPGPQHSCKRGCVPAVKR